jgi:prepilin-type N-terminal cleavage/methylation domain-containing protein
MYTTRQNILNPEFRQVGISNWIISKNHKTKRSNTIKICQTSKNIMCKNGFTIAEILIAISIISIWFAWIFILLQNSNKLVKQIEAKTIAINIAREWVEIMYNIRDTNRKKWPTDKDKCRLNIDPINNCHTTTKIEKWRYSIEQEEDNEQKYFRLKRIEIDWFDTTQEAIIHKNETQLCIENEQHICDENINNPIILRAIYISWLYDKTENNENHIIICNDPWSECESSIPKELRFCVYSHYIDTIESSIKICSILTNFQE